MNWLFKPSQMYSNFQLSEVQVIFWKTRGARLPKNNRIAYERKALYVCGVFNLLILLLPLTVFAADPPLPGAPLQFVPPPPPGSDRGSSTRRTDMGTRSPCAGETVLRPLVALIPGHHPALTTEERLTFWAYVPYSADQIRSLTFSFQAADSATPQTVAIASPRGLPGMIRIPLPASIPSLEVDQFYQWSLSVFCGDEGSSEPQFV